MQTHALCIESRVPRLPRHLALTKTLITRQVPRAHSKEDYVVGTSSGAAGLATMCIDSLKVFLDARIRRRVFCAYIMCRTAHMVAVMQLYSVSDSAAVGEEES